MKYIFLGCVCFVLVHCTERATFAESSILDSCFVSYNEKRELEKTIEEYEKIADTDNPDPIIMAGLGCIKYQSGAVEESKIWLDKSFVAADSNSRVKSLSASALSLIYIKTGERDKVIKLLSSARKHPMGRKMLVIYYVDFYRESGFPEPLKQAIDYETQRQKTDEEKATPGTRLQLEMMQYIYKLELQCNQSVSDESVSASSTSVVSSASATVGECAGNNLQEEKDRLFNVVYGTLESILKKEHPHHQE